MLNPLSIASEGFQVSGGVYTPLSISSLGYQVKVVIEDVTAPAGVPWPMGTELKKVTVYVIIDGVEYMDSAYTSNLDITVDDIKIEVKPDTKLKISVFFNK